MPNPIVTGLGRIFGYAGFGAPIPTAKPMKEQGVNGQVIYAGQVRTIERNADWNGRQKFITAADIVTNVSIVAAGTHHFLNLLAHPNWSVQPADESDEAKALAEFVEEVLYDMDISWSRVVRRSGMYRFHGFGIQEWVAKKRDDGKIGFKKIAARPQQTVERWETDPDSGEVTGIWQRNPINGSLVGIPRSKLIYLVEDTLTDSPEGLGIFRHLGEPYNRLKQYLALETRGFERDLRGTPIGRAPMRALNQAVEDGIITPEQRNAAITSLREFVEMQVKSSDTGLILDSQPFESQAADGLKVAAAQQWGVELLNGGGAGLADLGHAIDRLQREMARIIGVEHLMMGDQGGNRALATDKSRNLYLIANSVLGTIADGYRLDLLDPLWTLNNFDEKLKPYLAPEDVAFKDASQVATTLRDMATAGAVLKPNDPAIDDVRDLLGISHAPEATPQELGELGMDDAGNPLPQDELQQQQLDNQRQQMEMQQEFQPNDQQQQPPAKKVFAIRASYLKKMNGHARHVS